MYVCEPIHTEYLDVSEEKASYQIESISGEQVGLAQSCILETHIICNIHVGFSNKVFFASGMVSWGKIEITLFLGAQPVVTLVARHRRVFHLRDIKHDLTFSFNYAKLFKLMDKTLLQSFCVCIFLLLCTQYKLLYNFCLDTTVLL